MLRGVIWRARNDWSGKWEQAQGILCLPSLLQTLPLQFLPKVFLVLPCSFGGGHLLPRTTALYPRPLTQTAPTSAPAHRRVPGRRPATTSATASAIMAAAATPSTASVSVALGTVQVLARACVCTFAAGQKLAGPKKYRAVFQRMRGLYSAKSFSVNFVLNN